MWSRSLTSTHHCTDCARVGRSSSRCRHGLIQCRRWSCSVRPADTVRCPGAVSMDGAPAPLTPSLRADRRVGWRRLDGRVACVVGAVSVDGSPGCWRRPRGRFALVLRCAPSHCPEGIAGSPEGGGRNGLTRRSVGSLQRRTAEAAPKN